MPLTNAAIPAIPQMALRNPPFSEWHLATIQIRHLQVGEMIRRRWDETL
jgi:hypothetical protein